MSIAVGVDASSWLQQDASAMVPDTMPDTTGDFTIALWFNHLSPAIVLPAYKIALVLFTTADTSNPSYTDPSVALRLQQVDGAQSVGLAFTAATAATPFVTTGIEKRYVAVTYDGTTHVWTFYLRRLAAWEVVGTVTADFSGTPITCIRALNDGIASGSIGSMSIAYYRLWNGVKLNLDQLEVEANSGVARAAGVTVDTPLIAVTDLTDVSGSNSPWYAP
jgi:hypothetical protein